MSDDLIAKLVSQVGDDVQKIYDHEALFMEAAARIRELEVERKALRERAEKAEKAEEYHAIANAYAAWAGDIIELLEERLGELDMDSPSDQAMKHLLDRADAGIASEVRRALAALRRSSSQAPPATE